MNLLLDTHIAIWAIARPELLSHQAEILINDPTNSVFVSATCILEIAIKRQRGGRDLPPFHAPDAIAHFEAAGFGMIPIEASHCAHVSTLPDIHRDPFDRLMIAQALLEPFRLLTRDRTVARYSDTVILV